MAKEVVKPDDNPFTDAQLAGAILWGATFYGFTDHYQWNPFKTAYTHYGERAQELERKLYVPYIHDKKTLRELKTREMRYGIAFTCDVWKEIRYRQRHQNRQKRKRFYRLKNRIARLYQLDKRTYTITEIERKTGIPLGGIADKIFNAGHIAEIWRECHVDESSIRINYLIDLCSNYTPQATDFIDKTEEVVITAYTSPDNPLTQGETTSMQEYFKSLNLPTKFHFLIGTHPNVASALDVQFICISSKAISVDEDN